MRTVRCAACRVALMFWGGRLICLNGECEAAFTDPRPDRDPPVEAASTTATRGQDAAA